MLTLSRDQFQRARSCIFANAGEIDRAWFRYQFEDGDADAFLGTLAEYQHPCGGFGGLYYEFAYDGPCLKSTEIAVKYFLAMRERPTASPLIQNTMRYLLEYYLPGIGNWGEVVEPAVNHFPHCHWVRYRGEDTSPIEDEAARIRAYSANEKACFAAFVACYSELVPEALCREIIKYPVEHLLRHWDKNSPDYTPAIFENGAPYDIEYFQGFVPFLPDRTLAERLAAILRQNPTAFMELDFARSDHDYVHLPCDVVSAPDSVLYPAVRPLVDDSLDYRMKQQSDDGRWPLGWSFGGDAALQQLQRKYEAYRTLAMLVKLKRFGRINF